MRMGHSMVFTFAFIYLTVHVQRSCYVFIHLTVPVHVAVIVCFAF